MKHLPTILLTGFTGILGKRFAYRLAEIGYEVVCPIRAGSEAEAQERFQKIFHELRDLLPQFDESLAARIRPIPGDVRKKGLGLPRSILQELRGPRTQEIWHLAALLDLTESKSQDVYDTNLLGTLNVLEFAKQQGIPEIHYFSTFGSSGKLHEGIVREIPGIRPPSFRNTYERTKWEAERHVWHAQIRGEISATIYRPSIVVGDSVLGRYEQFNVFNHPFDIVSRVRIKLCEKQGLDPRTSTLHHELRVPGDQNATLNLVPLDFVMDTVMKIHSIPGSQGRVYHIVNPNPPSLRLIMETFQRNEPWEGLRWEIFDPATQRPNSYEKFIAKQLGFLAPYLMGEAIYDYSNVQSILAFHGGIPPLKNAVFLDAISKRGIQHGWQEARADAAMASLAIRREQLGSEFIWPEGSGLVVDFSPHHPSGEISAPKEGYTVTERFLGKAYRVRGKLFSRKTNKKAPAVSGRDFVLVPFGMGATRRGEAETYAYPYEERLTDEVFARMNQVTGFDLRAFARDSIDGHESLGDIHDDCCWAVADDLTHILRLFRDIQRTGGQNFVSRCQILPHSGGTYLAAWLAGIVSFEDMALIVHQCAHFMSENVRLISHTDVDSWFFGPQEKWTKEERDLLNSIRGKIDPALSLSHDALAEKLSGRLELVFSLNAGLLEKLVASVRENRINVSLAISMSPNTAVFSGNDLEMARFAKLFVGKRKIELKRVPLNIKGTPHSQHLNEAARHTIELLRLYDGHGRLRDPVIPFIAYNGEIVRTREDFIQAIGGIANQPMSFDRMIARCLENGGRHFMLMQSGMFSAAGDLFDGVIQDNANIHGYPSVTVHPPAIRSHDPHPICKILETREDRRIPDALDQPVADTLRWYEQQLSEARAAAPQH